MIQFNNEILDVLKKVEIITVLRLEAEEIKKYNPNKQFNLEIILSDIQLYNAFRLPYNVKMKEIIKSVIEEDLQCLYEITLSVGINEVDDFMKFAYFIEMFGDHASSGQFMKIYQNQR